MEPIQYWNRFQQFLNRVVFHTERPAFQNHMFTEQIRDRVVRRVEGLLFFVCVLAGLLWAEDFLLNKPPDMVRIFGIWRAFVILLAGLSLVAFQISDWFQRNVNSLFVLFACVTMAFSGILFGNHRGLDYPWFNFFAFMIPMFSIVLCVGIGSRILSASVMDASFVVPYVLYAGPGNINQYYLTLYVPLLASTTILAVVIGHVIYHYD